MCQIEAENLSNFVLKLEWEHAVSDPGAKIFRQGHQSGTRAMQFRSDLNIIEWLWKKTSAPTRHDGIEVAIRCFSEGKKGPWKARRGKHRILEELTGEGRREVHPEEVSRSLQKDKAETRYAPINVGRIVGPLDTIISFWVYWIKPVLKRTSPTIQIALLCSTRKKNGASNLHWFWF